MTSNIQNEIERVVTNGLGHNSRGRNSIRGRDSEFDLQLHLAELNNLSYSDILTIKKMSNGKLYNMLREIVETPRDMGLLLMVYELVNQEMRLPTYPVIKEEPIEKKILFKSKISEENDPSKIEHMVRFFPTYSKYYKDLEGYIPK